MADKRTTPDADAGARRRKRAAPTIDLTATEVQQAAAAGEPPTVDTVPPHTDPQPPPAQEQPQAGPGAATMQGPADNPWKWLSVNINGPALAAGIAGAALVTLVLFGLWLTGLVPIRYAGSTAMRARVTGLEMQMHDLQSRPAGAVDTKSIDALSGRLSKIEETIAKLPASDPGMADRVAAADNAMKSLGVALTALNRRSDDIAANAGQARDRAEVAEKAITELHTSVQELVKEAANNARDDIARSDSITDTAARLALSAAGLRDAAQSGAPFTTELAQARSLGADDKALAPLAPFAATGVPTSAALTQELRALIPMMLKISGAQVQDGGFLDRLQANAGKLVRVRPVDAPPGDDASAVLARIEIDAAHADIAAALTDLGKLPDTTRAPALDWITKAQARQAAFAAARAFAAGTARALGPPLGPPLGPKAGAQ